ncbi:MAG TPA: DUF3108 domain-containing protein [Burkholderiaceae bacterium]|nr:DUF3108 domain-containing protein [Burkholderiaceae bacterium]
MKITRFLRHAACALLVAGFLPASAQNHAAVNYKINLPPSADLSYAIEARRSGIPIEGQARVKWQVDGDRFTLETETRTALLGKILDAKTEGLIDAHGLGPVASREKRFGKERTSVLFNRKTKTISFSASAETYPIKGGEQDRNSVIWELIAVARAAPNKFKPGSEWIFFVAGQRDAEPWTFRVIKYEKLDTAFGNLQTVRLSKIAQPGTRKQQIDIWLAPSLEWYPVRLRHIEPNEDSTEQTLVSIAKKSS